jgi:hypothetical protein
VFQGGQGRVPWESISADLDAWISSNRRPPGVGLADPNDLRLAVVMAWLDYFILCQSHSIPFDQYIQFRKVTAGLHPIEPAHSQESSRRLETIAPNKESWVLEFDRTVTACHALGGMDYSDASLEYAKSLGRSKTLGGAAGVGVAARNSNLLDPQVVLAHHLGLPTGRTHPTCVIDGQEKALLVKWCSALPPECSSLILELVDAINEMQAHSPASVSMTYI